MKDGKIHNESGEGKKGRGGGTHKKLKVFSY